MSGNKATGDGEPVGCAGAGEHVGADAEKLFCEGNPIKEIKTKYRN